MLNKNKIKVLAHNHIFTVCICMCMFVCLRERVWTPLRNVIMWTCGVLLPPSGNIWTELTSYEMKGCWRESDREDRETQKGVLDKRTEEGLELCQCTGSVTNIRFIHRQECVSFWWKKWIYAVWKTEWHWPVVQEISTGFILLYITMCWEENK